MRDSGVITGIKGRTAVVSVDKKAECAGCGLCLFKEGTNKTEFYAKNTVGAKTGDTVIIEHSDSGKFLGAVLAFFVPLILIGLAVLIDYLFIGNEIWILVLSVAFIAVWYAVLAVLDKKLKKIGAFDSRIVSVITPENTDNSDTKE
ncbi:MAG: SoxR reducing system RseC family protein [Clostridia bacterium]|nr:SoxR reducing system RseC family protein [Clostridia bacterium]